MTKARDLASAAPAPSTVSATEIGYLDGVSSAIQTQIDGKSGTSHNHNSDYIAKTLTTTTGDMIYASSANTPARLGIGSTGNVLTVSGGIPSWSAPAASASGLTLITSQSFTSSTSIQVNNCFSSTYRNYRLMFQITGISAQSTNIYFRYSSGGSPNTSSNYSYTNLSGGPTSSPTASSGRNLTSTQFELGYFDPGYSPNNLMSNMAIMDIFAPYVSGTYKIAWSTYCSTYATNPINTYLGMAANYY